MLFAAGQRVYSLHPDPVQAWPAIVDTLRKEAAHEARNASATVSLKLQRMEEALLASMY